MVKNSMRFDEDSFDLTEHRKASDAAVREKARERLAQKQVKRGKIMLAIVMIAIFFLLFLVAAQLGLMNFNINDIFNNLRGIFNGV